MHNGITRLAWGDTVLAKVVCLSTLPYTPGPEDLYLLSARWICALTAGLLLYSS